MIASVVDMRKSPGQLVFAEALDWIERHPRVWDQNDWTRCFAGVICRLDPEVRSASPWLTRAVTRLFPWSGYGPYACYVVRRDDPDIQLTISKHAAYRLGITAAEAGRLFDGCNDLADIRHIGEQLGFL